MPKQFFEFIDSKSSKFWHVDVQKQRMTITYGRIGSAGRESIKEFADSAKAKSESEKLIQQKTKKGYQKVTASAAKKHVATEAKLNKKSPAKKKSPTKKSSSNSKAVKKKSQPKASRKKGKPSKSKKTKSTTKATSKTPAKKPGNAKPERVPFDMKSVLTLLKKKAKGADETTIKKKLKLAKPGVTKTQILNWAGKWDATAVVDALIASHADWDKIAKKNEFWTRSIPITKRLIADGFKVKSYGTGWFSFACSFGLVELASHLLDAGAKPTAENFRRAIQTGKLELIKLLLDAGTSPNLISNKGKWNETSPLAEALYEGRWEIAKLLIQSGANVKYKSHEGQTLLMNVAGKEGPHQLEAAKFFIKKGVEVDAVSKSGFTALVASIQYSSPDFTKFLIKQGANPNRQTGFGTPLAVAIDSSKPKQIQCLLDAGADIKQVNKDGADPNYIGKTALEIATYLLEEGHGGKNMVTMLKAAESGTPFKSNKKKRTKTSTIKKSWERIESALDKHPAIKKSLKKGATEKAISKVEKQVNVKLPADVQTSLKTHDGQKDSASLYMDSDNGEFYLMPATEIASEWKMWQKLVKYGEFDDQTSCPDKGVSDEWYNLGWIPLLSNGGGDSICVDLAPAKGGKKGQVILMNHESSARKLLAGSFKEFLSHIADEIEDGSLDS